MYLLVHVHVCFSKKVESELYICGSLQVHYVKLEPTELSNFFGWGCVRVGGGGVCVYLQK